MAPPSSSNVLFCFLDIDTWLLCQNVDGICTSHPLKAMQYGCWHPHWDAHLIYAWASWSGKRYLYRNFLLHADLHHSIRLNNSAELCIFKQFSAMLVGWPLSNVRGCAVVKDFVTKATCSFGPQSKEYKRPWGPSTKCCSVESSCSVPSPRIFHSILRKHSVAPEHLQASAVVLGGGCFP